MNKLRPEFKIGLLVVTGLVLLVIGVNYLKGFNIFARSNSYYAVYDNVSGLAVSNPVIINGYKVGQVRRIEFLKGGQGELIVEFVVEHPNLFFPLNSVAMIHSSDLLGTKAIRIDRETARHWPCARRHHPRQRGRRHRSAGGQAD